MEDKIMLSTNIQSKTIAQFKPIKNQIICNRVQTRYRKDSLSVPQLSLYHQIGRVSVRESIGSSLPTGPHYLRREIKVNIFMPQRRSRILCFDELGAFNCVQFINLKCLPSQELVNQITPSWISSMPINFREVADPRF